MSHNKASSVSTDAIEQLIDIETLTNTNDPSHQGHDQDHEMDDDCGCGHSHHHHSHQIQPFRNPNKVGRNEACPCGSGKKYKKCCL